MLKAEYPLEIFKIFNDHRSMKLLAELSKTLTDLFNYFEPAFFSGKFFVTIEIHNRFVLPEEQAKMITFDKESLINREDDFIIQIIENNLYLWDGTFSDKVTENMDSLIYNFEKNKEFFIAKGNKIDITSYQFGSRFSNEFCELNKFLKKYAQSKIRHSSCPIFNGSWYEGNRIFFKGGGKDIPESFMQISLKNYIDDLSIFKGEVEPFTNDREHTLGSERPVDLFISWKKSNRIALIEIKWLGKSKSSDHNISSTHNNSRAVEGYKQLKDYFELAKSDYPNKIIKCYLVVIDGRRWNTNEQTVSITHSNGMYYSNSDIEFKDEFQYWATYPNMEEPIRMFVEPICSN